MKVVATESAVTAQSVAIAVTLMCASLSQHYHTAVFVYAATVLCSFNITLYTFFKFINPILPGGGGAESARADFKFRELP